MKFQAQYWPSDTLKQILAQCKEQHMTYARLKVYEEPISKTETKVSVIIPTKEDPNLCHIYFCVVPKEKAPELSVELRTCINLMNKNDNVVITRQQLTELCVRVISNTKREFSNTQLLNFIEYTWHVFQNAPHGDWVKTLENNHEYNSLIFKLCTDVYKLDRDDQEISEKNKLLMNEMVRDLLAKFRELNGFNLDF